MTVLTVSCSKKFRVYKDLKFSMPLSFVNLSYKLTNRFYRAVREHFSRANIGCEKGQCCRHHS